MELRVQQCLPDGFLETAARDLASVMPEPTLFDLPGRAGAPLFVSVLLHGNEDTGLLAVQDVLRRHRGRDLPRPLLLFVGNVDAAAAGVRTLDRQTDFNRVWPGTLFPDAPEAHLMRQVVDYVSARAPFASIDIHNNTGFNPHYACVNRLENEFFHLARLFSRTVVYFEEPVGVQSAAMAPVCPAVTVECGKAGVGSATAHAAGFVEACLALSHLPDHPLPASDLDLLRTFAIMKVPTSFAFTFDGGEAAIRFRQDIDTLNFSELPPGTSFGRIDTAAGARLEIVPDPEAAPGDYFDYRSGEIVLTKSAIPAMLTKDPDAVRLDCLGYLMHRIGLDGKRLPNG